jgi:ABC-type phosphate/phosphonate transport system substrate-binding protein
MSGNHHQVLVDLLEGRCDLGGTHSGNYNTAGQRGLPLSKLKLLDTTGSTPHDAMVAGPGADPALKEALEKALLDFDPKKHAGAPYVGESERISGFAPPPSDYTRLLVP